MTAAPSPHAAVPGPPAPGDAPLEHSHVPTVNAPGGQGKLDAGILAAMGGFVLLIAAIIAQVVFDHAAYSEYLAFAAALLLGAPIVYGALKSMWTGTCSHDHGHGESCDHHHHNADDAVPGGSHMEELVALAIVASFALESYLEAAAVAFFMLIASLIEHRTAAGAIKELESLVRITPTKARRINPDGSESEVAASDLRQGDRVVVLPGDNIPADGQVVAGASTVNQANITGESLPVEKEAGDELFAGTINQTGRMELTVTRAGEDSTLGKVQGLILQAAQTRPAVVRELSKYTAYYTPVVVMLAGIIFVFTRSPEKAISLLLVACPCALILCGPTAIVAALSAAARLGVFVKSVADLEVVRRVTAVVFDKTGTLTTGRLTVSRMKPADGVEAADLLRTAAAAEANSRHPVAQAVIAIARKANIDPPATQSASEVAGRGVEAVLDGQTVRVGRPTWLQEHGIDTDRLDNSDAEGLSLLYGARGQQLLGWVGLADTLREGAAEAVENLEDLGVKQRVMITGDRRSPAARVAGQLKLTGFTAEALPGDKLTLVNQLKDAGHTVAVIGDGVNDGPALAAGHVSLAMGAAGSDVAIDAASIALMNNQLDRLPFLVTLSRNTVSVIRQNLIFTLAYILFMLLLLGLGYLSPLGAAIGHGVSSIVVIFNSARLVRQGEHLKQVTSGRTSHHDEPAPATSRPVTLESGTRPAAPALA